MTVSWRRALVALAAALAVPATGAAAAPLPDRDVRAAGQGVQAPPRPAVAVAARRLRHELGRMAVVDLHPVTGTARRVARLDGFLTPPSPRDAEAVVRGYLRDHPDLFGLDDAGVRDLVVTRRYVAHGRVVRLWLAQEDGGIRTLDNGLTANVMRDGSLVNLNASLLPSVRAPEAGPDLTAREALAGALRDAGGSGRPEPREREAGPSRRTRFEAGQEAELVLFGSQAGTRLAWRALVRPAVDEAYLTVLDAESGEVLQRRSVVRDATARVFDYYPGAPSGGTQRVATITGYLSSPNAPTSLRGPFARVFSDVNGDAVAQAGEEVPPSSGADFLYTRTPFPAAAGGTCPPAPVRCSWDHTTPNSWTTNRRQSATQLFWFINHFHDHLLRPGLDFGPAAGNFEGADPFIGRAANGAALDGGLPPADQRSNAFALVPPDGQSPELLALLFGPPKPTVDATDDASLMYHEYSHGVSERLVTHPDGWQALNGHQSGSMAEAWSDWLAMDALVGEGHVSDTSTTGEVRWGTFPGIQRSEPMDCPVGASATRCPGTAGAGSGGYTYGDMGGIHHIPETHADGEIWAQTLWDLRRRMIADWGVADGTALARLLVTGGMEFAPAEPTYLDVRDAMILADRAYLEGFDEEVLWELFARRGMGWFASASNSDDTSPAESFAPPPEPGGPEGTLTGIVKSPTGDRLAGATVYLGGHFHGTFDGDLIDDTDASGRYTIAGIPAGTYPEVVVLPVDESFDMALATSVPISGGATTTRNFTLVRDWAALDGGGLVTGVVGEDTPDCEPEGLLTRAPGWSWRTSSPAWAGDPGPKSVTVRLPHAVDVTSLAIDPSAMRCSTGETASLGDYRIELSGDGTTFRTARTGTFTSSHLFRRNIVRPASGTGTNVRFVRLVALSTQGSQPGTLGARYLEVADLQVYGTGRPSVQKVGSTLEYAAPPGTANDVTVSLANGQYTVRDALTVIRPGPGCSAVDPNQVTCPSTGINAVRVSTDDRDDTVLISAPTAATIDGGPGTDTLTGGSRPDRLDGGTGPDTLNGRTGADSIVYSSRTAAVAVRLDGARNDGADPNADGTSSAAEEGDRDIAIENAVGGSGADRLYATVADSVVNALTGGAGADRLKSRDGTGTVDRLDCGSGTDRFDRDASDTATGCETAGSIP